jgi:hypothetical protein
MESRLCRKALPISPLAVFMAAIAIIFIIYMVQTEITLRTTSPVKTSVIETTQAACEVFNVPLALPMSIYMVESSLLKKHMVFKKWENNIRKYVYSIPQMTYEIAYSEGFRGEPDTLMDYHESIYWSVKHIATLMYAYNNDICKVIMAYNAGDCISGNYDYLDKVLMNYRIYYPNFECEEE